MLLSERHEPQRMQPRVQALCPRAVSGLRIRRKISNLFLTILSLSLSLCSPNSLVLYPSLHLPLRVPCSEFSDPPILLCGGSLSSLLPGGKETSFRTMKGRKGKGATKKETREELKPVDDRRVGKRKAVQKTAKTSKRQAQKEKRAKKDPNKPKRPPSAFFVFLEEFRKQFKQEHPNVKAVSAVGKAGGEKWKSLSDAEKEPYEAKAAKRKNEYEKQMAAYNKKQESAADNGDDESDRSKSDVSDEDDEESGEEGEEEDD